MKKRERESRQPKKNPVAVKIGLILKRARLNRHYSLDDLHQITRIQKRYLKAIELGDFKHLPGGFYVRAFIKKYADNVGINGSELLKRFNSKLPDFHDPHYMNKISEDKLLVRAVKGQVQKRHSMIRRYIPLMTMIVVVIVVLLGVWVVTSHYHNGLATDYNGHSTSVSGMSSSSSSSSTKTKRSSRSKSKLEYKRKHRVVIKRQTGNTSQLTYHVTTQIRPIRLRLLSSKSTQASIKVNNKSSIQPSLKSHHSTMIKLPAKAKSVQFDTSDLTKLEVNGKSVKLSHKQPTQLVTLKFSK